MSMPCYFNGVIYTNDTPLFKSNDLSLLRGYGMFDYFRTYNGVPFRWEDYWNRFYNSAQKLHLVLPHTKEEVRDIMSELYVQADKEDIAFRFLLTGGYSQDGLHIDTPNFLIRTEVLPTTTQSKPNGIKVLLHEYMRDLPEIKSTNYLHMIMMQPKMKEAQAADLLFHKQGEVSELTRSNIFYFKDNQLITPSENILYGITRKSVIELAMPYFEVIERAVTVQELLEADEVFTTSSTKGVLPIIQIDDHSIHDQSVGRQTAFLQKLWATYIANWGK
jgi:D-alanine transaminase/branched-chain amino acid aminotransferase